MRLFIRFLLALSLLGLCQSVFASNITYWSPNIPGTNIRTGTSLDACKSGWPSTSPYANKQWRIASPGTNQGSCEYTDSSLSQWVYKGLVYKYSQPCQFGDNGSYFCNDSCDPPKQMQGGQCITLAPNAGEYCGKSSFEPKIINSAGECVLDSQADQQARCTARNNAGNSINKRILVGYDGNNNPINPGTISESGCVATVLSVDQCKAPATRATGAISLGPAPQKCLVNLSYTGEVAEGDPTDFVYPGGDDPGLCAPGEQCAMSDFPDITESQPCSYTTDGEGRRVCESFNYHGKPGESTNCGSFNGAAYNCNYVKQPTSNGISIGTVIEEKSNADGTTTTTKTDVHNKVVCSGVGSCKTETTTSKTVTIKDGNGNTVSQSGTCTGANCAPNGTGAKGDSDGDGIDDCATGADCSEEGTADIPGAPELEEAEEIGDSTGDYFGRIANAPIVSAVTNLVVPTGGSCPVYSAVTMIGTFDSSAFCNLAPELLSGLRYLFLALWAWAAIRLFMTA